MKVHFTPLNETTTIEDLDDGTKIEGFTEADAEAIESLGVPRYVICSKKRLKEHGYNEPHEFLSFPISNYYSYLALKDRRYLHHKKYSFKELARLGFTFEFYEKMVLYVTDWIKKSIDEKDEYLDFWRSRIRLIKSDLRATKDERLIELARRINRNV